MPKYHCPRCGKVGYLVLTEDKDHKAGTFSYRIRMIHKTEKRRKECLLTTLQPSQWTRRKRGAISKKS